MHPRLRHGLARVPCSARHRRRWCRPAWCPRWCRATACRVRCARCRGVASPDSQIRFPYNAVVSLYRGAVWCHVVLIIYHALLANGPVGTNLRVVPCLDRCPFSTLWCLLLNPLPVRCRVVPVPCRMCCCRVLLCGAMLPVRCHGLPCGTRCWCGVAPFGGIISQPLPLWCFACRVMACQICCPFGKSRSHW